MSNKVYEIITARILSELERGGIPWQQPWTPDLAPCNFVSRKPYRGINALVLSIVSQRFGCPYFATRRQIIDLGGHIRESERRKASLAVLWKWLRREDLDTGETEVYPICRYYRVWNLVQIEGIEWSLPAKKQIDPIEECEKIVRGYSDGPSIHHEESPHAYYDPIEDSIHVPTQDRFISSCSYYSVLFHELVHSTGHVTRLNRDLSADRNSKAYAREELTAEIGSAFILGSAGLTEVAPIPNSAAYIKNWMQALQNDPRCVVCAASRAQRAADWILGIRERSDSEIQVVEEEACREVA
jgi:antirestriction protein ArdC